MDLWARKTGRIEDDDDTLAERNERVYWGNLMEPVVLQAYSSERYAHRKVTPLGMLVRSEEFPFMQATLDARTIHPVFDEIPLDAKNTDKYLEERWAQGAPDYIAWQVRHQAVVENTAMASVAVAVGGNRLLWTDVPVLDSERVKILEVAEEFWWHCENDVPPLRADAKAETRRALAATFVPEPETQADLGNQFVDLDHEYASLVTQLDAIKKGQAEPIEKRIEEIKQTFAMAMGTCARAELSNGVVWTLKRVTREPFVVSPKPYNKLHRKVPK